MVYRLLHTDSDHLTPEEIEVKHALQDYEIDPERMDMFVPTRALHETYLAHVRRNNDWRDASTLKLNQFGFALRVVYPAYFEAMEQMGEVMPCRRRINGAKLRGLCGWIGPESREVQLGPGRPSKL